MPLRNDIVDMHSDCQFVDTQQRRRTQNEDDVDDRKTTSPTSPATGTNLVGTHVVPAHTG